MKKRMRNRICMTAAASLLLAGMPVMAEDGIQNKKIGVVVYDLNDSEVQMFRNYYENYIADGFPVEFLYSAGILDWNDEEAFLKAAIAQGVEGFISFYATNLPEALKICGEQEVFYMMGSGNIDAGLFDEVKENEWFLGCIGPDDEADYQAGADMVQAYVKSLESSESGEADAPVTNVLLTTGGASMGNHMHEMRAKGALEKLAEIYGYTYDMEMEEILSAGEPFALATGIDGVSVEICPGYDMDAKLEASLAAYDADAVLSVMASENLVPRVLDAEKNGGHDIWVGVIDCFSMWNQGHFQQKDDFGNSKLNYVAGKYASVVGPAFAAMFQAIVDGTDMLRPDGQAFHLNQGFWTADNAEEYNRLYSCTQAVAINAYSNIDLMQVIPAYNPDATFEDFKALTEASDADSALARMGIQ